MATTGEPIVVRQSPQLKHLTVRLTPALTGTSPSPHTPRPAAHLPPNPRKLWFPSRSSRQRRPLPSAAKLQKTNYRKQQQQQPQPSRPAAPGCTGRNCVICGRSPPGTSGKFALPSRTLTSSYHPDTLCDSKCDLRWDFTTQGPPVTLGHDQHYQWSLMCDLK